MNLPSRMLLSGVLTTALLAGCSQSTTAGPTSSGPTAVSAPASIPPVSASPAASAAPSLGPLPSPSSALVPVSPVPSPSRGPLSQTNLEVSYSQLPTSPNIAASEAGIFQQNGLNVDLQHIAEGVTGMQALLGGSTQIGELGGTLALSAAAQGADPVVVANLEPRYPFKLMVTPGIQSLSDLKGKTIGITTAGSTDDIATRQVLLASGLTDQDLQQINFVPIGAEPARVAALLNKTIDGTDATPAAYIQLQAQGEFMLLDYATANAPAATAGIVVQRAWLDAHRDVMQAYIDSLVEATAREKRDPAFVTNLLQTAQGISDPQVIDAIYQEYVQEGQPALPFPTVDQYSGLIDQLADQYPQARSLDLNKILDPSFVQSAADRGLENS